MISRVTFPNLKLQLDVNSVAFRIGGIPIYFYAIFIVIGIAVVFFFLYKDEKRYGLIYQDLFSLAVLLIPVSIIGARLYYVAFRWDVYKDNLGLIWNIRDGGLALYGGLILGTLYTMYFAEKHKMRFWDTLDWIVLYLPLAQAIGRLGNFFNVEAYGIETNFFLKMGIEKNGVISFVHPTFLYEIIALIIIFVVLNRLKDKRRYSGQMTYIYICMYSFFRFFIEYLRADSLMFMGFKATMIVSLIAFVWTGILLLMHRKSKQ
ncbi:MAG: prolipoprotein diacylglyceryl transferase [Clostridia bacterium]|nr:prolipoprotein diacylglyceryl transferase [Clostridia bacterium]